MQANISVIVEVALGAWNLWLLVNILRPIKRLGLKSRKAALILLVFSLFVEGVTIHRHSDVKQVAGAAEPAAVSDSVSAGSLKADAEGDLLELAKDKGRQQAWIATGQDAVQEKLKDPSSAQFRNSFFHLAKLHGAYTPMSCGQVNSKNALGGYAGYQRYISAGTPELTFLEEEMAGFDKAWKMMCVD